MHCTAAEGQQNPLPDVGIADVRFSLCLPATPKLSQFPSRKKAAHFRPFPLLAHCRPERVQRNARNRRKQIRNAGAARWGRRDLTRYQHRCL
jgi:hypothetical protein